MPVGATLAATGVQAGVGIYSASKAAGAANDAADKNNALIRELYGKSEGWLSPYINRGNAAGDAYNAFLVGDNPALFEAFKNNTGFKSNLREGVNALSSNAATKGLLHSGGTLKAAEEYGMELNDQYADKFLGRLGAPVQWGLSGANALAGVGTQVGGQLAANNNMAASATGNAWLTGGAQVNNALGQFGTAYGMKQDPFSNFFRSSGGTSGYSLGGGGW